MKKLFLMLLAACTLSLAFTACGKDDNNENNETNQGGGGGEQPVVTAEYDCSAAIGMNVQQMLATYGEPTMGEGTFYAYMFENQKVSTLSFLINPDNQKVYTVYEILTEGAYTVEELTTYFGGKYTLYGKEDVPGDDEEGIAPYTNYFYGNAAKQDDATLIITVSGNTSIYFVNPKNEPAIEPSDNVFAEWSPIDIISLIGEPWADLEEDYGDAFMPMSGMQYADCSDNEWVTAFALSFDDNNAVSSITLFFDDGLEPSVICEYFTENGWTVSEGEPGEEEEPTYIIYNETYEMILSAEMGRVSLRMK